MFNNVFENAIFCCLAFILEKKRQHSGEKSNGKRKKEHREDEKSMRHKKEHCGKKPAQILLKNKFDK